MSMSEDVKGVDTSIDLVGIAKEQAVQGEKIGKIEEACDAIHSCLLGNGKIGLVTRTDRLEQKDKAKSKLFWIVLTIVTGLLFKAAFPEILVWASSN